MFPKFSNNSSRLCVFQALNVHVYLYLTGSTDLCLCVHVLMVWLVGGGGGGGLRCCEWMRRMKNYLY